MAEIIRDTWPNIYRPSTKSKTMNIEIYTTPGCGYCVKIKELMNRAGISDYTEINIPKDMLKEDFKIKFPFAAGYPYVVIDGVEIGGLVQTVKYFIEKGLVSSRN